MLVDVYLAGIEFGLDLAGGLDHVFHLAVGHFTREEFDPAVGRDSELFRRNDFQPLLDIVLDLFDGLDFCDVGVDDTHREVLGELVVLEHVELFVVANGDYEQLDVFKNDEFTKDFAMGVVDAHVAEVESVEEIKDNIKKGLEVVPPEQLTVSPDRGIKLLPREVAYGKMENMVQAAREIEQELDAGEIDVVAGGAEASADD